MGLGLIFSGFVQFGRRGRCHAVFLNPWLRQVAPPGRTFCNTATSYLHRVPGTVVPFLKAEYGLDFLVHVDPMMHRVTPSCITALLKPL